MVIYGNFFDNGNVPKTDDQNKYKHYQVKLGKRIKELRNQRGLTQEELALDVIKMNVSYLAKIENGYINTSLRYLVKIAHGLNVEVKDLIEF